MLRFVSISAAAVAAVVIGAGAAIAATEQGVVTTTVTVTGDGNAFYKVAGPLDAGQYWLGIECLPAPRPLRAQLNLSEKQGLLVIAVVPESPAAKAGVKEHDVLVRVGDKPLGDVRDLVQAVEAAKETKLKIELIRGGKPQTVEATPRKRTEVSGQTVPPPEAGDWGTIQKWMEGMWAREGQDGGPMRFWVARPGAIVPKDVLVPRPLPPDMSVVISKEGDKPANITVKRGDKKWEANETQLDKFPADVRPFVDQMLGRSAIGLFRGLSVMPGGASPEAKTGKVAIAVERPGTMVMPGPGNERLQQRLDEMDRRLEKLLRAVESLQSGHGQQPPASPHEDK
ncbi:MAG: PDZ domain-containing protein [Planctomycetaceae bacterium]|nr:PDZ domain-containing protein [Planctomycetaceae bacterium]